MLVTMKEMLADAKKNHYAIPAFDCSNYEMMKSILEACEEERSPALLMALGVDIQGRDLHLLTSMIRVHRNISTFPSAYIWTTQPTLILSNMDATTASAP